MTNKVVDIKSSNTETRGARTILTFKEPLTHQNSQQVQAMVNDAINQHKTEIILNCKEVSFIDSVGLELMSQVDEELRKRGGMLKVVGLNAVCSDILIATRLINVFHVYKDVPEAIRSST